MHAASFRLKGPDLLFRPDAGKAWSPRALPDEALAVLRDAAAEYRRHLGRDDRQAALLALGRRLFAWLDGGEGWLAPLLKRPLLVVAFEAFAGDEAASTFLRAPWELLADGQGHLAARAALRFAPVRRVESAQQPPPPSDHRLSLVFMAASPRDLEQDPQGLQVLAYEREEEAILDAAGGVGIELEVEESGDPDQLAERLARIREPQVLHLSCHGTSGPEPCLLLETEEGDARPTGPDELTGMLAANPPRLLFLSACQTAQAGPLADSLAESILAAGIPAVIGWDGSVRDDEATAFARVLYQRLGPRADSLEQATAFARQGLLAAANGRPSRDWHLARLWLGPAGGGRLVGGAQRARLFWDPEHGFRGFKEKENLDPLHQASPVASREMFVGRRRELQKALSALKGREHGGVLLHGMGRLGKSSLAARIAQRLGEMTPVVVFGRYDALAVAEAIARTAPALEPIIAKYRPQLPDDPARLESLLNELVTGPCREPSHGEGASKALLLVIDDAERLLDPGKGGKARVLPEHRPVLQALLRAFDPGRTGSRLLLTSRWQFTLMDGPRDLAGRLADLPLPPLDLASRRKLARRRLELAADGETAGLAAEGRDALVAEAAALAQGNPGLQELLAGLALSLPVEEAEAAFAEMRTHLEQGAAVVRPEIAELLERLAIDKLLEALGAGERTLLEAMTLFALPLPVEAVAVLGQRLGGDPARLFALGLLDGYEDVVEPSRQALAVNALVRPRLLREGEESVLKDAVAKAVAAIILPPLLTTWSGLGGVRPWTADAELARLAVLAGDAAVFAATGAGALAFRTGLQELKAAAALAAAGMKLLDAGQVEPSLPLLRRAGEAFVDVGELELAERCYARAVERLAAMAKAGKPADPNIEGTILVAQARLLTQRGEPDTALLLFEQAWILAEAGGNPRNQAVVAGDIARLKALRGEVDEARAMHQEQLATFEAMGDQREQAVTLGEIARLKAQRGEVDEALAMHQERLAIVEALGDRRSWAAALGDIARLRAQRDGIDAALRLHGKALEVMRALGDADGIAAASWDLSQLRLRRGEIEEAVPLVLEAYAIFQRTGRLDGLAVVGTVAGQILVAAGEHEEGLEVLRRSAAGFRKLGRPADAEGVEEMIRAIEGGA